MSIHIGSNKEDIAPIVLMPGDPMRAKYIAKVYLKDYKLINSVRGMSAYTGYYKGTKVTVFPSGMGIPSMGIYAYELFKFYDVKKIIRIGTAGANRSDIKLLDIVLSESSYSLSTFAKAFENYEDKEIIASNSLNDVIKSVANNLGIGIKYGKIISSDVFDPYIDDVLKYFEYYPKNLNSLASEMESFALFFMANKFKREATCLVTIVDSKYDDRVISSEDREKSLDDMITLALESCLKL